MATASIADKLAKLETKIAKREKTIADETKELEKDKAEYNRLYIMLLSDKYKLSGKDLFSAIEREHEQLEKLRESEQSDDDADGTSLVTDDEEEQDDTAVKHSSFSRNNMSEGALNLSNTSFQSYIHSSSGTTP